ncbi:MAG: chitobiase/beta-hexosaminidase C-terminal domain-containing protein [Spirochaetales bacterium]|nr:chitobiase/beta-hexosaminidase C-terminal domain-containing protein [Spirochaetales bacterium]
MIKVKNVFLPVIVLCFLIFSCELFGPGGGEGTVVKTPVLTPGTGEFFSAQAVSIVCETPNAILYYTLDGDIPTIDSSVYSEPLLISTTTTIKALAVANSILSDIGSVVITISSQEINQTNIGDDSDLDMDGIKNSSDTDIDGDGIANEQESSFGTSIYHKDTDGDGWSDYEEILNFSPESDPRRFNPLIADLPRIELILQSNPSISMHTTSGTTTSAEESLVTSNTFGESRTKSNSYSHTQGMEHGWSVDLGMSASVSGGLLPEVETSFSVNVGASGSYSEEDTFSWSEDNSIDVQSAKDEGTSFTTTHGIENVGGEINVAVRFKNSGNIAYKVDSMTLAAYTKDPDEPDFVSMIGSLDLESSFTSFPSFMLTPGQSSGTYSFENGGLPVNEVLEFLGNESEIIVDVSGFQLSMNGRDFTEQSTDVYARTSAVFIDYGDAVGIRPEQYLVASKTKLNPDFTGISDLYTPITMGEIMDSLYILNKANSPEAYKYYEVTSENGILSSINGNVNVPGENKYWAVIHKHMMQGDLHVEIYSALEDYDFEAIEVGTGDEIHLIYVVDDDGDGLPSRTEDLYGTDDSNPNTDGDNMGDRDEVDTEGRNPAVSDNPTIVDPDLDTDGDGLTDVVEIAGWDILINGVLTPVSSLPNDMDGDSDNDGLSDKEEKDGWNSTLTWWNGSAYQTGTFRHFGNPQSADTDNDSLNDYDEVKIYSSVISFNNGDWDDYSDYDEVKILQTPPNISDNDRDSDGIVDVSDTYPDLANMIVAGYHATYVIIQTNLGGWGYNHYGELQGYPIGRQEMPQLIDLVNKFKQVSAGYSFVTGVKTDGTIWSAGYGDYGQLGRGVNTSQTTFGQVSTVAGVNTWKMVSSGGYHSLAIRTDGTLWAWGHDLQGQLGNGTTAGDQLSPVQIGTKSDWATVAAGGRTSYAIDTNGKLYAWGNGSNGALDGTVRADYSTPTQIGTGIIWAKVSASLGTQAGNFMDSHVLALSADGGLYAWGNNSYSQIGLTGSTNHGSTSNRIGIDVYWKDISAGSEHSLAVKYNGTVYGWGRNLNNELTTAVSTTSTATPTHISTLTEIASVTAGENCSFAVNKTGTMFSWGNEYIAGPLDLGRLGNGTAYVDQTTPYAIPGIGIINP